MTNMDFRARKLLAEEALEFGSFNRRSLLARAGALAGAGLLGKGFVGSAEAAEVQPAAGGKKVRIGIPLTYGPFNQPWRRGCWQVVQTVLDLGGEPVTIRGEPTKASEQDAERSLLDRNIDCLVMGIYSLELETAYIADEAKKRGVKTVGFAVPVKDSPSVVEDTWATAMTLGYYVHNALGHHGTIVQTAEDKGFYTPFDMEADMLEHHDQIRNPHEDASFHAGQRIHERPDLQRPRERSRLASGSSGARLGQRNRLVVVAAHPWRGAGVEQQNRNDVRLFNHYFSDQFLKDMAAKTYPIEFSTDVPWHLLGKKTGELAISLARGEKVEPLQYRVPVTAIVQEEAAAALAEVQKMDKQAIALLGQYGG